MQLSALYSCDEISSLLNIARSSTSRRRTSISVRTRRLIAAAAPAMAPCGRPQNATRAIVELLVDLGILIAHDPDGMAEWIAEICGETMGAASG